VPLSSRLISSCYLLMVIMSVFTQGTPRVQSSGSMLRCISRCTYRLISSCWL